MIFLICDVIVRSNSIMFSLDMYPFFKYGRVLIGKTGNRFMSKLSHFVIFISFCGKPLAFFDFFFTILNWTKMITLARAWVDLSHVSRQYVFLSPYYMIDLRDIHLLWFPWGDCQLYSLCWVCLSSSDSFCLVISCNMFLIENFILEDAKLHFLCKSTLVSLKYQQGNILKYTHVR